jgi:sensor histidine kinase YesM
MDISNPNNFIFSSKYRVWRHLSFWTLHILIISAVFSSIGYSIGRQFFNTALWVPIQILYCYPIIYYALPKYLLKEKYARFAFIILLWAIGGWFLNYLFRAFIFIPLQQHIFLQVKVIDPWQPGSFLVMTTMLGITSMIVLFKYWVKKQQEWMQAEKEKVTAELQLLKAQVHPHFLFNTLNNIYSFSLRKSPKTPELIMKLSSLLSYILYDCRGEHVPLEKELEVMKNYIDLEKERYANNIEISWNVDGDVKDKSIVPLLLLPFLENAFKHGTSEQLEKPWLSVDIAVKQNKMKCKIVNSKNEFVPVSKNGIGIVNVQKRLRFLYPNNHELKINDEGDFFAASLLLELTEKKVERFSSSPDVSHITKLSSA